MSPEELSAARRKNASEQLRNTYAELDRLTGQTAAERIHSLNEAKLVTPLFYPGQKVVCINDEFTVLTTIDPSIVVPAEGTVYTVRKNYQLLHDVGITLEEINNLHAIPAGRKLEPNFSQSRFSAVQTADVSQLAEVLEEAA